MAEDPHHAGSLTTGAGDPAVAALGTAAVVAWLCLAVLYLAAGRAAALRGRHALPLRHAIAWLSGTALGLAMTAGPLARAAAASSGAGFALLHHAALGPLLHVHFVVPGTLFVYAVAGIDPHPHRSSVRVRAGVVIASIAVHGIVAKHLYAVADRGGLPPDTEQAARLMYYGGDVAHALLLVVFCAQAYRESGRRLRRAEHLSEAARSSARSRASPAARDDAGRYRRAQQGP